MADQPPYRDASSMPIAIIGMACRFPGSAIKPEKLWDMLISKQSARTETPPDRWNVDSFYHPDPNRKGALYNRGGHYLDQDMAAFDAPFFSISPLEAQSMDPMQRLLLEVTYEATESAGIPLTTLAGSNTSCYVGCFTSDYLDMQRLDPELSAKYQSVGTGQSMLSNRLSHFFDLKGPSMTTDTACSSSLVAVHLACQSLRTCESEMAIVGASNAMLNPIIQVGMSNMQFLSKDSTCYAFDERANGYARGEGITTVILKPLDAALRDNDTIRAIIRGTAVNSDGRTPGITMPDKDAQVRLIKTAYQNAGCKLSQTAYFEAHGTGTAAGDPVEAAAVGEVFASHRPKNDEDVPIPLNIGTIKTNIGHLEGAAGLAGLIKAALSVEKGVIAPNLWFEKGNPAIDFEKWRIKVPTDVMPWPVQGLRRASVNSFGYGGTNVHVVLDDVEHYLRIQSNHSHAESFATDSSAIDGGVDVRKETLTPTRPQARIFPFSAHEEKALKDMLASYARHAEVNLPEDEKDSILDSLAYTLCERRSALPYRVAFVASTKEDLVTQLKTSNSKLEHPISKPRIAFIFTGQGAQWWGMGRELLQYPVFNHAILACDRVTRKLGADFSLLDELLQNEADSRVDEACISQPLCTAVQIALVDLFAAWNVHPQSVVGHSSGEIAAAYAIGALTLDDAMKVSYFRGLLSAKVKNLGYKGSMMAVGMSEGDAQVEIDRLGGEHGRAVVACINSPRSVTVSGDSSAINELQKACSTRGVFARKLQVDTAYHSHHMLSIAKEYAESLSEIDAIPPGERKSIKMFSSVSGKAVESDDLCARYWVTNLVSCVRFSDALQQLCSTIDHSTGVDNLVEIGPHAALAGPVKQVLTSLATSKSSTPIRYLSALNRGTGADVSALNVAAILLVRGHTVATHAANFSSDTGKPPTVLTNLPTYPWNHTRHYWTESRLSRDYRFRPFPRTDILCSPVNDWNPLEPRWRNFIRLTEQPWVRGHQVQGVVVYPAAGYVCMAVEAMKQLNVLSPSPTRDSEAEYRLRDISITQALVVPETDSGVEIMLSLWPQSNEGKNNWATWYEFRIFSSTHTATQKGNWAEHCRGMVTISNRPPNVEAQHCIAAKWTKAEKNCTTQIDPKDFYAAVHDIGLHSGPEFQGLTSICASPALGQGTGVVHVTDICATMPSRFEHDRILHPTTLDSIFQVTIAAISRGDINNFKTPAVPTFIEDISISGNINSQTGDSFNVVATARRQNAREIHADMTALNGDASHIVVRVNGLKCTAITSADEGYIPGEIRKHCFRAVWEPDITLIDPDNLNRVLRAVAPSRQTTRMRDLELLAWHYVTRVLQDVSEEETATMLPHHRRLFQYLQHQRDVVRSGHHPCQVPERIHTLDQYSPIRIQYLIEDIEADEADYEGRMLVRMGSSLPSILRQEIEPLTLMLRDNLLSSYYAVGVGVPATYPQLARYITLLSHKNPKLTYLEIGAGTGGATIPVLEALGRCDDVCEYPRLKSYTYTDVSSGFFEQAREKFDSWEDLVEYKKLDIELDPCEQEFEKGQFDVIIAANVLHATSNINHTMENVRKLLKTGGKLILLEITQSRLSSFVISGTLPGWWNASEEWRKEGPLLNENEWRDVLKKNGFEGLDASSPDVLNPLEERTRIMVATAIEHEPSEPQSNRLPHRIVIIRPEASNAEIDDLIAAFKSLLDQVGIAVDASTLGALETLDLINTVLVSFAEFNSSIHWDLSSTDLQKLQRITRDSDGLIWVTRGANSTHPELSLFQGLARTVRAEYEGFHCTTLDLDGKTSFSIRKSANHIFRIYQHIFGYEDTRILGSPDCEFLERDGLVCIKRAIEDTDLNRFIAARTALATIPPELETLPQQDRPLSCNISGNGDLGTLMWVDNMRLAEPLGPDEVDIDVHAAGLNRYDVVAAVGYDSGNPLGSECTGFIVAVGANVTNLCVGDRVATWGRGSFATRVRTTASCVQKIPDTMSFPTAASLPVFYVTAYYCLVQVAHLAVEEKVLLHGAADGVGQAAIQLAQNVGAEVWATVTSNSEKDYLVATYGIEPSHVLLSNDSSLADTIRQATDGEGVDVVMSGLSGEEDLRGIWKCLASCGRFIELQTRRHESCRARHDILASTENVTLSRVNIDEVLGKNSKLAGRLFAEVMDLVRKKKLKEVTRIVVKPWSKLKECMEQIRHTETVGKIVLQAADGDRVPVVPKPLEDMRFPRHASYLLAGGLGGLGRSVSRWMACNGAKHLIFVSRTGATSLEATGLIDELHAAGVRTATLHCDIADEDNLSDALSETLQTMPPLRGIIQAAMVLNDQMFTNMTLENYTSAIHPKVQGSWSLHRATLGQPLDFFVMLSSAASFVGNPGQANYAAGCMYQVALASYRRSLGLPATALDLGKVANVGYIAENVGKRGEKNLSGMGLLEIEEVEMLAMVEIALRQKESAVASDEHIITGLHSKLDIGTMESDRPYIAYNPVLSHLPQLRSHISRNSTSCTPVNKEAQVALPILLDAAKTFQQAQEFVLDALIRKLSRSLMMRLEDIDPNRSINAYGVDSLIAVEIKNWVSREMKAALSVFEVMQASSVAGLAEQVAMKSPLVADKLKHGC